MRLATQTTRRGGAAAVEMAIVLPLFVALVMGTIEASRLGMVAQLLHVAPEHIRDFHAAHYQLGGMGMIAVLPRTIDDGETLRQLDGMLRRLQPEPTHADAFFLTEASLPPINT